MSYITSWILSNACCSNGDRHMPLLGTRRRGAQEPPARRGRTDPGVATPPHYHDHEEVFVILIRRPQGDRRWRLSTGLHLMEIGKWKLETGIRKLEIRNSRIGVGSLNTECGSCRTCLRRPVRLEPVPFGSRILRQNE